MARTPIDVLILDVAMPARSGLDVLAWLQIRAPEVAILVFTGHPADPFAGFVMRMGARGFLNKLCDPIEVVHAVRTLANGKHHFPSEVAEFLAKQPPRCAPPHRHLTDREFQVFYRLAMGERACTIAAERLTALAETALGRWPSSSSSRAASLPITPLNMAYWHRGVRQAQCDVRRDFKLRGKFRPPLRLHVLGPPPFTQVGQSAAAHRNICPKPIRHYGSKRAPLI
ncbi:response regulator transcription factor [Variovorax sp. J22P271]|uniref:response regulator n=1 Tax=Variovorax davisae TaxID=3053515 RepID=UPI002577F7D3|nr:response regulator transcription factor [Variovorax sp. J22P271]MDM0032169.1 response regulator transcription factor [Variovorax sp. J22P271]